MNRANQWEWLLLHGDTAVMERTSRNHNPWQDLDYLSTDEDMDSNEN